MFFQKIVKSSVFLSLLFLYQSMQEIRLCLVAASAVFAVQVQMEHVAVRRDTLAVFRIDKRYTQRFQLFLHRRRVRPQTVVDRKPTRNCGEHSDSDLRMKASNRWAKS